MSGSFLTQKHRQGQVLGSHHGSVVTGDCLVHVKILSNLFPHLNEWKDTHRYSRIPSVNPQHAGRASKERSTNDFPSF